MFFFVSCFADCTGLRNVRLTIEPRVVQRHHHSILHCKYDQEDEPLYTVKWYRGPHEFYRYTPTERPPTKVFPYAGITVDVNHSNSTQVLLQNIEFNLSGNFSCEVTIDGVVFSTGTDTQSMLVVQLPEHPPTISVGHERLDYGHILRANCSSPPSKPPAHLKFLLNNVTVARTEALNGRRALDAVWSDLVLELPLTQYHFTDGRLILSCVAQVSDIYQKEATLELASARNPVPERVSAVDCGSAVSTYVIVPLVTLHVLLLINS
ncbi:PREDICTED: uncharacterized protein LOC108557768 [Nicrophorus vespilloides]|uniref:Uncharacterized protein LOC108557768 n=1 Tax=Nicrophorus vespilloides TaxID=110193 RepID=A0ABM1M5R1_NICVS|nr:PREDICTED: uncharacterized protein LOC108557768 [Nicrophorus vespilloides]